MARSKQNFKDSMSDSSKVGSKQDSTENKDGSQHTGGADPKFQTVKTVTDGTNGSAAAAAAAAENLRISSSFTWETASGARFNLYGNVNVPDATLSMFATPGMCAMHVTPTFGSIIQRDHPLNMVFQNMMSVMRRVQAARKFYDMPALAMFVLALVDIASFVNWLVRIYGEANTYSSENRYINYGLLQMEGVDYEDVVSNKESLLTLINDMIYRLTVFAIPKVMPYVEFRALQFTSVFKEGEDVKSQLYMYVPDAFYMLKQVTLPENAGVETQLVYTHPYDYETGERGLTIENLRTMGNAMLSSLTWNVNQSDINGDIARAYGSDLLVVAPITADYTVVPEANITALETMQNAKVVGPGDVEFAPIRQMKFGDVYVSYLASGSYCNPIKVSPAASPWNEALRNELMPMTTILTNPSPQDVFARQIYVPSMYEGEEYLGEGVGTRETFTASGAVITACVFSKFDYTDTDNWVPGLWSASVYHTQLTSSAGIKNYLDYFALISAFKFVPYIHVYEATGSGSTLQISDAHLPYFDWDNFMLRDATQIREAMQATLYYMLNTPRL